MVSLPFASMGRSMEQITLFGFYIMVLDIMKLYKFTVKPSLLQSCDNFHEGSLIAAKIHNIEEERLYYLVLYIHLFPVATIGGNEVWPFSSSVA